MGEQAYLRTDNVIDFISSMRMTIHSLDQIPNDPTFWKWVVLGIHSALQGALVCHLSGTADLGALKDGKVFRKYLAWLRDEPGAKYRQPDLCNVIGLVERLQNSEKRKESAGEVFELTLEEESAIKRLHKLRIGFTHYPPQSWSIEIDYFKKIILPALNVIKKISEDPWPFRHADEDQKRNIVQLLALIEKHETVAC